ncbi:3-oxoacid CoA-transferase subunit B [Alicycliphilus denitrificans]|uniref:3-oxoacid CoA-transferase subunit B n=1 Tax=Alicycliphilus denitrificans TaxID=179636 RepID=A0A420K842_9BURK|nr:3-oxoacid CoA-transferase subunit B [Alicycliphilus denitrificans]RKJ94590.1 3-oxoacid CoA-transferase subunit B [Alicycliphilus denitrificans]
MMNEVRNRIAARVARDIPEGSYVNLGIGLPTLVANHIPADREVILHSENGVLGRWHRSGEGQFDPDVINAGKEPIHLLAGAALFHHADSFAMMRGGHLDICVLGGFQVSERGDLANWHAGDPNAIPAVGGAMDLAVGAKRVFVTMEHVGKNGVHKILRECTYPLTGSRCVSRIYTDLAVLEVHADGLHVIELSPGVTREQLAASTGADLIFEPVLVA